MSEIGPQLVVLHIKDANDKDWTVAGYMGAAYPTGAVGDAGESPKLLNELDAPRLVEFSVVDEEETNGGLDMGQG